MVLKKHSLLSMLKTVVLLYNYMYSWERMSLGRELWVQTKASTWCILQNISLKLKELWDQSSTMERKAQAIKDCILKQPVWKKENLHPKTWLKSNHVKGFTEFILPKDIAEDDGYDSKEMCEYRFSFLIVLMIFHIFYGYDDSSVLFMC